MDVKFTVVTKELLSSVEHSDGQIIAIYDEPGLYYEMGSRRYSVMGMQFQSVPQKPTTSSITDANTNTFYFYDSPSSDGGLYIFNGISFVRLSHTTGVTVKVSSLRPGDTMYLTGSSSYTSSTPMQEYGSSDVYVKNTNGASTLYAPTFQGNLTGTATKAEKDANNNNITSYMKSIQAVSGTNQIKFLDGAGNTLATIDVGAANTAGATDTNDKLYLVGAKAQGNNPQTYSNGFVYTQSGELYSDNKQVANTDNTLTLENKTLILSYYTINRLISFGFNPSILY